MASTTYQYILDLKDKMSGSLKKAGVEGSKTYDQLQRQQERLNDTARGFTSILGKIGIAFGAFELGKKIITAGADIESTRASFEVLLGSIEKGNEMIAAIKSYGALSPYEAKGLMENAKLMLAFGINQEKVLPTMQMLGDVAMGNQEKMNSLTLAYAQMSATGRLMGQDLLQMINAGFNPLQIMAENVAKTTGVTMPQAMIQLKKAMEDGKISAAMVEGAFRQVTEEGGKFFNMAERQGQTVAGRWSTLIDNINQIFTNFGEQTNSTVGRLIESMIRFVEWVGKNQETLMSLGKAALWVAGTIAVYRGVMLAQLAITKLAVFWQAVQLVSINVLGDGFLTASVAQKVFAAGQWAINAAMSANPIGLIIAGVAALTAGIIYAYNKFGWFRGAILASWEAIKGFGNIIKEYVVDRIKGLISGLGSIAEAIGLLFKGKFSAAYDAAKEGAAGIFGIEAKANAINNAKKVGEQIGAAYKKGVGEVQAKNTAGVKNGKAASATAAGTVGAGGAGTAGLEIPGVGKDTAKGISEGGSRPTNVNITLGNLVETLNINTTTMKEGTVELEQKVREALLRVLNSANGVAYGN